ESLACSHFDLGHRANCRGPGGAPSIAFCPGPGTFNRVSDQWSSLRCVSGWYVSAPGQPTTSFDRHARKYRLDALCLLCHQNRVDVVCVAGKFNHPGGGVVSKFCFRARTCKQARRTCAGGRYRRFALVLVTREERRRMFRRLLLTLTL